jgi:uncharacterized membrane protein
VADARVPPADPALVAPEPWWERLSHRSASRSGELRLPTVLAVMAAAALHAALPTGLLVEPRWVVPTVEVLLLVPLTAMNPTRLNRENSWSRAGGVVLVLVVIVTNAVSLVGLLSALTGGGPAAVSVNGRGLLLAALQVWLTNIIAFALVYWELDRGGPVARWAAGAARSGGPGRADFSFPLDDPDAHRLWLGPLATADEPAWMPVFVDYLYLSVTDSVAFSPTDTLPLSARAKLLMAVESLLAMITFLLVVARAVNILH